MNGSIVAVVGAESTGKTQLCGALAQAWSSQGRRVAVVDEYLREFCEREGRTPRRDEQMDIALEQTRRIEAAALTHELVVADTTALMPAIYSRHYFDDASLMSLAQQATRAAAHTLLMGLDLGWEADGFIREGPHMQLRVDADVRAALAHWGAHHAIILGRGAERTEAALRSCEQALRSRSQPQPRGTAAWRWACARCDDALAIPCAEHEALGWAGLLGRHES